MPVDLTAVVGGRQKKSARALDLSLVDELCISQVPVLFGTGIRYFGELIDGHVVLEDPVVVQGTRALHLRYPVRS